MLKRGYEASELGLRPGFWPAELEIEDRLLTKAAVRFHMNGVDIEYAEYETIDKDGIVVVRVYND